jgi:hypothetical protein
MISYNYKDDYNASRGYEYITTDILAYKGYFSELNTSTTIDKLKEWDVKSIKSDNETELIEVKFDRYTDAKSNNICIEYSYKGAKSGIRTTKARNYYYFSTKNLYVINTNNLRNFLNANKRNPSKMQWLQETDSRKSACVLIDSENLIKDGVCIRIPYIIEDDILTYVHKDTPHKVKLTNYFKYAVNS